MMARSRVLLCAVCGLVLGACGAEAPEVGNPAGQGGGPVYAPPIEAPAEPAGDAPAVATPGSPPAPPPAAAPMDTLLRDSVRQGPIFEIPTVQDTASQ